MSCYSREENILEGFNSHFENLPNYSDNHQFNNAYNGQVELEVDSIIQIAKDTKTNW